MAVTVTPTPSGPADPPRDPYAVFAPRRARRVIYPLAAACAVLFGGVAVLLPPAPGAAWQVTDRFGIALFGLAGAALLLRLVAVRAWPDAHGLRVRNLVVTRRLEWAQIVAVRFGGLGGEAWAVLDLDDGQTLSVMAIQRADGEYGRSEAARLAALVDRHTRTGRDSA